MSFSPEILAILKESLPTYYREGQGGNFPYVKGEDVIRQLNKAFGHAWSSEVVKYEEVHGQILLLVALKVQCLNVGLVEHQGFGSARIPKNRSGEILEIGNAYKSAFTNALKKAAEQFGVGVLSESEEEPATPTVKKVSASAPYTAPQAAARPQYSPTPKVQPTAAYQARAAVAQQTYPVSKPGAPAASSTPQAAPPSAAAGVLTGNPLSDVQKNALKNLVKFRGVSEEALVSGALKGANKNSFEQLTDKEAVDVIRYANSLPKK